ncbi:MAG: serine acetyltransferase [Treponema sp.]|nr:serine acetyltransferase [Treponema sp.]
MKIDELVENILKSYETDGGINKAGNENFPNRENVVAVLHDLQSLIFPGYKTAEELDSVNLRYVTGQRVNRIISLLTKEIEKALTYKSIQHDENSQIKESHCFALAEKTSLAMVEAIPEIRRLARLDAIAAFNGDPAAKSGDEVIVSYPGLEAIIVYRISHFLHECGVPVIPRIMSEHVHGKTGIDIHPGAKIGESFFIDHGTGVVIGETSVIGNNVKIYQGVTLGALSVKKSLKNTKRHPTIEDNVTIYANATILGGETVIGKNSVIGGNSWITESVSNAKS